LLDWFINYAHKIPALFDVVNALIRSGYDVIGGYPKIKIIK